MYYNYLYYYYLSYYYLFAILKQYFSYFNMLVIAVAILLSAVVGNIPIIDNLQITILRAAQYRDGAILLSAVVGNIPITLFIFTP